MNIGSGHLLCPIEADGIRRKEKQQIIEMYPRGKCIGCKSCYMHYTSGGLGMPPIEPKFEPPYVGLSGYDKLIPGKELVTDTCEPFLSEDVALVLKGIYNPLNLITKLPGQALASLRKHDGIWKDLDYHIQVTTLKDGEIMDMPELPALVREAKSVSARVDPIHPGMNEPYEIERHIRHLKGSGINHITVNTLKVFRWHDYPETIMRHYSDGDTSGSCKTVNADVELEIFKDLRRITDELDMTLGVCMSRQQVQDLSSGPCEGRYL